MKSPRLLAVVGVLVVASVSVWIGRQSPRPAAAEATRRALATAARPVPVPKIAPAPQIPTVAQPIGAAWTGVGEPVFARFRAWTERYLSAPVADRPGLLAEGRALAAARRAELRALIRRDPRRALALAVPMVVRQDLPEEIVALLEERVAGQGRLALLAVTPAPGQKVAEPLFRSALIGDTEYRAYVFGRREVFATVGNTSIIGIALEGALAVAESPLRQLEAGERIGARAVDDVCPISGAAVPFDCAQPANTGGTAVAVEYSGKVRILCCAADLPLVERRLLAAETSPRHAADNQPGTASVATRPDTTWTHGVKRLLVIRVDFSDKTGTPNYGGTSNPMTDEFVVDVVNAANGVADFYEQSSFNQTTIALAAAAAGDSPDVTPVLRMPQSAAYYAATNTGSTERNELLHNDARALALAAGYNETNYERVGVLFANLGGIAGSQIAYAGLGEVVGKYFWVNGYWDFRVVAHEIGHNYGLPHANLWKVTDGNPISSTGTSEEYGDEFDIMGGGDSPAEDFSPWNKSLLRWIPDTAVATVAASGTHRMYRFDHIDANLANSRALKIVRDTAKDYWIGYRRGTNYASPDNGAYILWGYNTARQGDLLDMTTPGSNAFDAALAVGATFNDAAAGITIRPLAQGGSGAEEYLDVQVDLLPLVAWKNAAVSVSEGSGTVTLAVERSRGASGAVSVNYATAPGTAGSSTDFAATSGTLTWADGDTTARTVTLTLVRDGVAETAPETFTVTLSGATGSVTGDPAVATVTIVDAGVRDPSFSPDFVDNTVNRVLPLPDGGSVLGGWFSQVQTTQTYSRSGITRVTAGGAIDVTFASAGGTGGTGPVHDLARLPDGKFIAVGGFTTMNGTARSRIARLNADGSLDAAFDPGTGANGAIYAVLAQPDGKIVIGGSFTSYNGTAREYLARLNADGSLDSSFLGVNFGGDSGWRVESLALQPDGKVLVGGSFYFNLATFKAGLCRVTTAGVIDSSFNGIVDGAHAAGNPSDPRSVQAVALLPDGKIVIGGDFTAFNNEAAGGIARLTSTGALDASFTAQTNGTVEAILVQPDGALLIGGSFTTVNGATANRLARLAAGGARDADFASAGGTGATVYDLAAEPDGAVVFGGDYGAFQGSSQSRMFWRMGGALAGVPGSIQFGSASAAGYEGNSAQLTVTRTGDGIGALTVGYATVAGTAGSADFTATAGTLTWADGDVAAKTIAVPLASDALTESGETFTVNLGAPLLGGALLGGVQQTTVTVSDPLTGYAAFNAANFNADELANAAVSGPSADPDGDGLANLVEYALGLNPRAASTANLPAVSASGGDWVFTYTRPSAVTDVTFEVQFATNLVTANWGTGSIASHAITASSGGIDTWQARVPQSVAANGFFRLKVTR